MLKSFIDIIEEERKKIGMSKGVLCQRSGISQNQYCNLLNGYGTKVSTIESLLKALNVKKVTIRLK